MEQASKAAQAVTDFFQGNPFQTPVGQYVERATDGALPAEDWELNMQICDMFNHSEEYVQDGLRAIRKRLQMQMGRNNQSVLYALTLLETCVKNGKHRVHKAVADKEFIQSLVMLIGPKYDPPQLVQEKVLNLIQAWADAFRQDASLQGVCEVYDELKTKGVEFPMTDLDSMAPILTPKRTIAKQVASPRPVPAGSVHCSDTQLGKLRSEFDVVNGNLLVFREMLSEMVPGKENGADYELMVQLHDTCKQMQQRLLQLLHSLANHEVTNELLLMNDELNQVFEKYDRYQANRQSAAGNAAVADSASKPSADSLIDFNEVPTSQLAQLEVSSAQSTTATAASASNTKAPSKHSTEQTAPFDMFAQSRSTTFEQSRKGGSSYTDNTTAVDQIDVSLGEVTQQRSNNAAMSKESASEAKEMENWLKAQSTEKPKNENDDL